MEFLKNLRYAPDETKQTFAVVVSAVTTVAIVALSVSLFNPLSVVAQKDDAKIADENLPSPFSAITSEFTTTFGGLKSDLSSIPVKGILNAVFEGNPKATTTSQETSILATTTIATTTDEMSFN